jgi:hypothetical protein
MRLTISREQFEKKRAELEKVLGMDIKGDTGTFIAEHVTVRYYYSEPSLNIVSSHNDSSPYKALFPTLDHGLRGFFTEPD